MTARLNADRRRTTHTALPPFDDEPFTLQQPKPERRPLQIAPPTATRQGVLFAGANCLPGQLQLMASDGPRES